MNGHLDLLALDAVRAGDATPEQRAHAEQCGECRATVERFGTLAARLTPAPIEVPARLRQDILAIARPRKTWRPLVAAAAAILIAVGVWIATRPSAPHRMDIIDAYSVAARLRNGQAVEASWDLNGDGKVDAQDVEEIARRSVSLR